MTETLLTAPTVIEDVDLDAVIPCADPRHDHPADVVAACTCPRCGVLSEAVCWAWWKWLVDPVPFPLVHSCLSIIPPASVRIVEVLR